MTRFEIVRRVILADLTKFQKAFGTAIAIAAPTALRFALGHSANPVPFVTYFPAVMFASIFLGWRWAAIATMISAAIVNRVFLTQPWLRDAGPPDVAILIFFGLSCAVLIFMGDTLRRAVRDTERIARERDMLSAELYHRVQNVLSVITAMVQMGKATEIAEFREDLTGRIQALSKANRILKGGLASTDKVDELIEQVVAPFSRDGAMFLHGPSRTLPSKASYQLVLILHELCTNAVKHGALSVPQGQVHVSWTGEPDAFRLEWRETGGPPVSPPTRKGIGSRLLAGQTAFAVEVTYEPGGILASIMPVEPNDPNDRC